MCGIAGRFNYAGLPLDREWQLVAEQRLRHRGPDDHGAYADGYCELVHCRLALLDLSPTGHQPLANEDGNVLVVFNGELYNHRDLRSELKSLGHTFRGTSDTEVLVHLYEELGARMAERLRGMFAFAIYDSRRRSLFMARDRFGIKPLYYARLKDQFVFASEIKAILALEGFKPGIDRQACYDFLGLGYVPEPATAFAEIRALPCATTLLVDSNGFRLVQFHATKAQPDSKSSLNRAVEMASACLLRSVESQRVADVPVAALLSGGIDSSLVVAAACQSRSQPPRTFNVRFPDGAYDETGVAKAVSSHYGTPHQSIDLLDWSVPPEMVTQLLEHFDQPFADTSFIPMYVVAKAIRERGIICALSGDGGDEAFGGYARFWRANRLTRLMKLPGIAKRAAVFVGDRLSAVTDDLGRQLAKAMRFAEAGETDSSILIAGLSNYLSEDQKNELMIQEFDHEFAPVYRHFNGHEPAAVCSLEELSRRMTENLFAVGLPGDMLRKVDMMSMLVGLEIRVPMLDEQLVAAGLRLPHCLKTDGKRGKLVLRRLAEGWLPRSVAHHPKHGFSIPLDRMVNGRFHQMLADVLLSPQSYTRSFLKLSVVEGWLNLFQLAQNGHRSGNISRAGLYQRIIIVLALELWLRKYKLSW